MHGIPVAMKDGYKSHGNSSAWCYHSFLAKYFYFNTIKILLFVVPKSLNYSILFNLISFKK